MFVQGTLNRLTLVPVRGLEVRHSRYPQRAYRACQAPKSCTTHKETPALWNGVSLYPMDSRTIDVLWNEDPQGVRNLLTEIQRKHTLFVVDCFPGHPLFAELSKPKAGLVNIVVTSPRDDAILQARRLIN